MAIDQSPATTAKSLLNGIDYSALIGGPLEAAIKAQATAANSTLNFILKVGFEEEGENKFGKAKNVTFEYFRDGELQKLIVPVLIIVPIPCIEITDVEIEFMAKINASSSTSTETSKDTSVNASLSGSASAGWGPFSIKAKFSAGMSSKYSSKASQDSKYSVEYNQKVSVKAGQAGLPDGLQTILNILSSSVTGANPNGEVMVSPANGSLDYSTPGIDSRLNFELHLKDDQNMNLKNTPVTVKYEITGKDSASDTFMLRAGNGDDPIDIGFGLIPQKQPWIQKSVSSKTDNNGKILFSIWLDKTNYTSLNEGDIFDITAIATIGEKEQQISIPVSIINCTPPAYILTASPEAIEVKKSDGTITSPTDKKIVLTVKDENDNLVKSTSVTITSTPGAGLNGGLTTTALPIDATDENGTITFTLLPDENKLKTASSDTLTLSVNNASKDITVTVA